VTTLRETRVLYHDLFTNGVVYLDVGFDLHTLPADLLPYVRCSAAHCSRPASQ